MSAITVSVSQKLRSKLPNFFPGARAVIPELAQNAFRAKATDVWVTQRYGFDGVSNVLVFRDNGCGITNWEAVLTGGDSDWEDALEPAGLGIFSYFGLGKIITISSLGKRVTLTEAALLGEPVIVEDEDRVVQGTEVVIYKTDSNSLSSDIVKNCPRSLRYYPFNTHTCWISDVDVSTNSYSALVIPESQALHVPGTGTMVLGDFPTRRDSSQAIWMGQPLSCWELPSLGVDLTWIIDPTSGVRPKLPDRDCLISNEHTRSAVNRLMDHLRSVLVEHIVRSHGSERMPFGLSFKKVVSKLKLDYALRAGVMVPFVEWMDGIVVHASCADSISVCLGEDYTIIPAKHGEGTHPDPWIQMDSDQEPVQVISASDGNTSIDIMFVHGLQLLGEDVEVVYDYCQSTLWVSPKYPSQREVAFSMRGDMVLSELRQLGVVNWVEALASSDPDLFFDEDDNSESVDGIDDETAIARLCHKIRSVLYPDNVRQDEFHKKVIDLRDQIRDVARDPLATGSFREACESLVATIVEGSWRAHQ